MEQNKFTKYERARILGARALQIAMNAPLLIKIESDDLEKINFDALKIAEIELNSDVLPISIKKPMPKKKEGALKRAKVPKISDKNILLTAKIPGKVNFVSIKPINKSQIYDLLISVLKNKGYTLIDSKSGYFQIVRSSDATRESPPFRGESTLNQIQTDIIGIKNLSAAQMLSQVNFLLSKYGKIAVSKEANSLIITDYPNNLKSIRHLINQLDSQKKMDIKFYILENSKVTSVLPKIKSIATSIYNQKMPSQKVSLFADEGTNTLIIVSKQKIIDALLLYVKKLDKKDAVSQRSLHIVNLKNSDAKLLAATLKTIISQKPVTKGKKVKADPKKPTFTADKETNILMIYASQEEFKEIHTLIQALDVPRQQVYVSAKIVEISNNKSRQVGAKYGFEGGVANSAGLYSFSTNLGSLVGASSTPLSPTIATKLAIPSITKGLALGATISLISSEGAANILSEPSLLCVNNLESSIYVGKTQSIITQGQTNNNSTNIINSTYTRQDIGLTLKIKPRISNDNKVLLDISKGKNHKYKVGAIRKCIYRPFFAQKLYFDKNFTNTLMYIINYYSTLNRMKPFSYSYFRFNFFTFQRLDKVIPVSKITIPSI